jgi:hypothetical protein
MALERAADALSMYERNLKKEPNRLKSLYGAARAAELSGDAGKAREYYMQLATLCAKADTPDRAELRTALLFLQKKKS